jgi:hypothetical protein
MVEALVAGAGLATKRQIGDYFLFAVRVTGIEAVREELFTITAEVGP